MSTNHDVWDSVANTDGTTANSFEFLVRVKSATTGAFEQSADITAVNPAFTSKTRARQSYASKGVDLAIKYGDTLALSFDVEAIRDDNGQYQQFLQDLIDASKVTGIANLREIQVFDALGADYAFDAKFAISVSRTNTGWDDAGWYTITATQYGSVQWIDNPVLVGNVPSQLSVTPTSAAAAAHVFIQGVNLADVTGPASVKFGATNATSYVVHGDTLIDAVVPAGAGSKPITVTNPDGAAAPIDFTVSA